MIGVDLISALFFPARQSSNQFKNVLIDCGRRKALVGLGCWIVVGYGRPAGNAPQQRRQHNTKPTNERLSWLVEWIWRMNETNWRRAKGARPTHEWKKEKKPINGMIEENGMFLPPFFLLNEWFMPAAPASPRSNFIPIQLIEFPFRTAWLHLASQLNQSTNHSIPIPSISPLIPLKFHECWLAWFVLLCE